MIEKVHGLQATSLSLNDRFTLLHADAPVMTVPRPRRRSVNSFPPQNVGQKNNLLIQQIARHLEQQARRQAIRHRLGGPGGLRRFNSEGNLSGLRRSNSFGNLSQYSGKSRASWRQSSGDLSTLGVARRGRVMRGARWRGTWVLKPRFRDRQNFVRNNRLGFRRGRGAQAGAARGRTGRTAPGYTATGYSAPGPARGRGRGRGASRSAPQPVPTKEELDAQLEQYMSGSRSALDRELDAYMRNAMDLE